MEQALFDLLLEYGYIGIFLFLMLGIVGLPLPDEIMMTFVGYLSSVGRLQLVPTFLSALVGSMCGITLSYVLGLSFGYPFLKKYGPKIFITRRRLRVTRVLFRKYGSLLLFFGYFIPGVRHVTAYLAGISNIPFPRFALYAYTGAVFWSASFIGLGYVLGANWEIVFDALHQYGTKLVLVALPFAAAWIGWILWNPQHKKTFDTK
ncbi:DedA family protein [Staphylospora marina]|uniref:DedA family protein n=1 Tax=Staphylospora marina TaxID=2490858 RepID=UPI000F5BC6C2|nr:DedA family protein [Staphylospora marina]